MAIAQKYSVDATTKTHGLVDATFMEIANPTVPVDGTGGVMRAGLYGVTAWLLRGYKENKTIGF